MTKIPKNEIVFKVRDWHGREVTLLKSVLKNHIARFHIDEILIIQTVRAEFNRPRVVIENTGAHSENAIFNVPCGGHQCILVAIKYRKWMGRWFGNLIATFYGIDESAIPPGRVLYGKR